MNTFSSSKVLGVELQCELEARHLLKIRRGTLKIKTDII